MRIVLDAMGSDEYPVPDVAGAVSAAREWGDEIILVGQEKPIQVQLARHDTSGLSLRVVHAPQVIEMEDEPAQAARSKQNSSMHVGMRLVRAGLAEAYVTAGNTGGVLAVATLYTLRRIHGVKRPGLATIVPLPNGSFVTLDIGANVDCGADVLFQFAVMGSIYAQAALDVESPRLALLSNGEEPGKGNSVVKETYKLLSQSDLNFVGNIEPKDAFIGQTDVVIHDGFSGNVFIKTTEAVAKMLTDLIREEIKATPITAVGGLLAKPAFRRVAQQIDPFEVGGAALLGVNGVVIIAHGRSNARAIKNAIRQARKAVQRDIVQAIGDGLGR